MAKIKGLTMSENINASQAINSLIKVLRVFKDLEGLEKVLKVLSEKEAIEHTLQEKTTKLNSTISKLESDLHVKEDQLTTIVNKTNEKIQEYNKLVAQANLEYNSILSKARTDADEIVKGAENTAKYILSNIEATKKEYEKISRDTEEAKQALNTLKTSIAQEKERLRKAIGNI